MIPCQFVLKKGQRRGEICGRQSNLGRTGCAHHWQQIEMEQGSTTAPHIRSVQAQPSTNSVSYQTHNPVIPKYIKDKYVEPKKVKKSIFVDKFDETAETYDEYCDKLDLEDFDEEEEEQLPTPQPHVPVPTSVSLSGTSVPLSGTSVPAPVQAQASRTPATRTYAERPSGQQKPAALQQPSFATTKKPVQTVATHPEGHSVRDTRPGEVKLAALTNGAATIKKAMFTGLLAVTRISENLYEDHLQGVTADVMTSEEIDQVLDEMAIDACEACGISELSASTRFLIAISAIAGSRLTINTVKLQGKKKEQIQQHPNAPYGTKPKQPELQVPQTVTYVQENSITPDAHVTRALQPDGNSSDVQVVNESEKTKFYVE